MDADVYVRAGGLAQSSGISVIYADLFQIMFCFLSLLRLW